METHIFRNFMKTKNIWFGFGGLFALNWFVFQRQSLLYVDMFGQDGNGGKILKIVTNLTDEEMARLKHVKRMNWHFRGQRMSRVNNNIEDAELRDRGIEPFRSEYVEYIKRPPHDKFL